jgi:CelD/BcsL family acetyltransferase involved in cellulose biosynthesis
MDRIPGHVPLSGGWEGEIYRNWNFPPDVIESWNSLARNTGDLGLFLGYGWFKAFWQAFGKSRELFVVVLKKEGLIKAIFPCCMIAGPENGRWRVASLTNDHTCHYDFMIEPDVRQDAISSFIQLLRRVVPDREITFEYMPASGQNVISFIRGLHRDWIPVHMGHGPWAPWLEVSGDWDRFFGSLPRKLRENLKRYRKKAEENGKLQFEVIRQDQRVDEILDVLFEIEYGSWKGVGGTAIKSDTEVESFYRRLAHWAVRENGLFMFLLKLDGRLIAGSFCLSLGKTVFGLKLGHDRSFDTFSPGSLLQAEIVKYLCTMPEFSVYNFLGACDPWKMRWTSLCGESSSIRVYPKSLGGWGRYFLRYGWKIPLKRLRAIRLAMDGTNQSEGCDNVE